MSVVSCCLMASLKLAIWWQLSKLSCDGNSSFKGQWCTVQGALLSCFRLENLPFAKVFNKLIQCQCCTGLENRFCGKHVKFSSTFYKFSRMKASFLSSCHNFPLKKQVCFVDSAESGELLPLLKNLILCWQALP